MGIRVDPGKAKKVLSLITIFSSLFFAGFINTFGSEFGHSFSPFIILACIVQRGFPFGCFFFLLLVFGGLSTAFYQMYLKTPEQKDPMGRNFVLSDSNSYGQAHFEQPEEYENEATIETPETALGMIYGQYDDTGTKLITQRLDEKHRGNRNVAVIGASGSGKTYTLVEPTILQIIRRRESLIITDPDGGLYRDNAPYCRQSGYNTKWLTLNDMERSDGWDCLKSVRNVEDATLFAEAVISNVLDESDQNSIYGSGSKILLKALILRVILDKNLPEEEKTIQTVYRSLIRNRTDEQMEAYIYSLEEQGDTALPCLDAYRTFQLNGDKMRTNIRGNLAVYLQVLADPWVSKILSTNDIDLELPGTQPCAYFCGFPDSHSTYKFITALFFSMIFIRLYKYADVEKHGKLDIPVNFILDEFPSIGGLPDWDKKMATLRKRNINVTMIFQDIAQFQNIYERSWATLLNNCKTMIILGINEDKSAALMSKRIGNTTIKVKSEQHANVDSISDWWSGGRVSEGEGKRELVSYSELFRMHEDDAIVLFQGHNPVYCRKYPYPLHPDAEKLIQVNFDEIPKIDDTAGRQKRKEEEERYIEQYLAAHPLSEVDRTYTSLYKKKRSKTEESAFQAEIKKLAEGLANKLEKRTKVTQDIEEDESIQLDITETFTINSDSKIDEEPEIVDSIEISDDDDDWEETTLREKQRTPIPEGNASRTNEGENTANDDNKVQNVGDAHARPEENEPVREKEKDLPKVVDEPEKQEADAKIERKRKSIQQEVDHMERGIVQFGKPAQEKKSATLNGLPSKRKKH